MVNLHVSWTPKEKRGFSLRRDGHWIADPETGDAIMCETVFDAVTLKEVSEAAYPGEVEIVPTVQGDEPGLVTEVAESVS